MRKIRFLRLSQLAQEYIIELLNVSDLIMFSLVSKRCRRMVLSTRRVLENLSLSDWELKIFPTFRGTCTELLPMYPSDREWNDLIWEYLRTNRRSTPDVAWALNQSPVARRRRRLTCAVIEDTTVMIRRDLLADLIFYSTNPGFCSKLYHYILDTFRFRRFYFADNIYSVALPSIYQRVHYRIERFTIKADIHFGELLNIIDNLRIRNFRIAGLHRVQREIREDEGVEEGIPGIQQMLETDMEEEEWKEEFVQFRHWKVEDSFVFLTLNRLLGIQCVTLRVHWYYLRDKDLNKFIKYWLLGGYDQLELVSLADRDDDIDFDNSIILEGVTWKPWNPRERPRFRGSVDCEKGMDIVRGDKMRATIIIEEPSSFKFLVWHERHYDNQNWWLCPDSAESDDQDF